MKIKILAVMSVILFVGCDRDRQNANINVCTSIPTNKNQKIIKNPFKRDREKIMITDVVLHESEGGWYTNNRFACKVQSPRDCELWLEVRDYKDGHQFSYVKDSLTCRTVAASTGGTNSIYNVRITVDGDGEKVKSVVTLFGKLKGDETVSILFQTNAIFGTWKGR